jgi:hypothetical protein
MMPEPFQRVVLTKDLPEERLRAGDVGVVVERYPGRGNVPEGYELEFFARLSQPAQGSHWIANLRESQAKTDAP